METKLIKVLEHYHLYDGDKAIATTIVGNPMLLPNISLKNCQAIELGYDLDELAKEFVDYEDSLYHSTIKNTYMHGFQKAIEILGDKKYSEDDVNLAFVLGKNKDESRIGKLINSRLQQTEWDVEIEMGNTPIWEDSDIQGHVVCKKCGEWNESQIIPYNCKCVSKPKLDANGCLILKRK